MGKKESVPDRRYTPEFKLEAVRLAESVGGQPGGEATGDPGFEYLELAAVESGRQVAQNAGHHGAVAAFGK